MKWSRTWDEYKMKKQQPVVLFRSPIRESDKTKEGQKDEIRADTEKASFRILPWYLYFLSVHWGHESSHDLLPCIVVIRIDDIGRWGRGERTRVARKREREREKNTTLFLPWNPDSVSFIQAMFKFSKEDHKNMKDEEKEHGLDYIHKMLRSTCICQTHIKCVYIQGTDLNLLYYSSLRVQICRNHMRPNKLMQNYQCMGLN